MMNKIRPSVGYCPAFKQDCIRAKKCIIANNKKVIFILENKINIKNIYSHITGTIKKIHNNIFSEEDRLKPDYKRRKLLFDHYFVTPIGSTTLIGHYQCNDNDEVKDDYQKTYLKKMSSLNKILKVTKDINEMQKDMLFAELDMLFQKEIYTVEIWDMLKIINKHLKND